MAQLKLNKSMLELRRGSRQLSLACIEPELVQTTLISESFK